MFLLSQTLVPIDQPPIPRGIIEIENGTIIGVYPHSVGISRIKETDELIDLSHLVIFPGFINTHCHLELTALGPLKKPTSFVSWIRELIALKQQMTAKEITDGILLGSKILLESGVTTIGDHVSLTADFKTLLTLPQRLRLFGEVLGLNKELSESFLSQWKQIRDDYFKTQNPQQKSLSISPHALHTVYPPTLKKIGQSESGPFSIHLMESPEEVEYFKNHTGEFADLFLERGMELNHDKKSSLQLLEDYQFKKETLLLVHGNYFNSAEQQAIISKKIPLAHCPGSHTYFGHTFFDVADWMSKGATIGIGTDSLASNQSLNFLDELRRLQKNNSTLTAEQIIYLATTGGAKALKMDHLIGSITIGKKADLIGFTACGEQTYEVPLNATKADWVMAGGAVKND